MGALGMCILAVVVLVCVLAVVVLVCVLAVVCTVSVVVVRLSRVSCPRVEILDNSGEHAR